MKTWSANQNRIFSFAGADEFSDFGGKRNGVVIAVAGAGKSTTLEETAKRIRGNYVALVFGAANAKDLKARGMNARTFHSLCYGPVLRHKRQREVTENKLQLLCEANMTGDDCKMYQSFICRLVSLARQTGIGHLVNDTPDAWIELAEHHDLELEHENAKFERAIGLARALLECAYVSPLVDWDDLLYIAVRDGLHLGKFDFVLVDEAQDTNAIQRAILRKIMNENGRMIAVGDPAQAIYGFRGADSESMNLIAEEFECGELPLTVSYRCPKAVVKYARQWVNHIEAAPDAAEGSVLEVGTQWTVKSFAPGDLIVCRTTRPLVTLAYQLIKARIPARIAGKEIGKGLIALINRMNAKGVDRLIEKLNAYTTREVEKLIAKKQEVKADAVRDKTDCIMVIIDSLSENDRTVPAVIDAIESLFKDYGTAVVLSTIHRAKGLEADTVFWLNRSQCPSKYAKQEWQMQQENNLCYVAATRAKVSLVLIEEKQDERQV